MRMATWFGTALTAVALFVFSAPDVALARDGMRGGGFGGGFGRGYGGYGGYAGYRSFGSYGGFGRGYSGWSYGRPYSYGYGYRSYGYPYGYRRYGYPYSGYGYGLGYGYPYLGGYGLIYGGYGYPYSSYGYYGYDYPYSSYYYGPSTTIVEPTAPPSAPSDFISHGTEDFKAGRYNVAIREWEHAMVDNPQNGELALLMGQALFAVGRYDEAAGVVQHALSMLSESQWGEVISSYRQFYGNPSDYSSQLKALEAASRQKDSAAVRFLLGYHYGFLGYPREAVRELDKALEINPQDQLASKLKQIMTAKLPAEPEPAKPESATPESGE